MGVARNRALTRYLSKQDALSGMYLNGRVLGPRDLTSVEPPAPSRPILSQADRHAQDALPMLPSITLRWHALHVRGEIAL
jgi:hypothetical protein